MQNIFYIYCEQKKNQSRNGNLLAKPRDTKRLINVMAVVWVSIGKDSIEVIDRREKTFDISLFMRLSGDAKTRVNLISMLIFTHFN